MLPAQIQIHSTKNGSIHKAICLTNGDVYALNGLVREATTLYEVFEIIYSYMFEDHGPALHIFRRQNVSLSVLSLKFVN